MRIVCIYFLLFFHFCFAQELKKTEVIGNKRLDKQTVLSSINFAKGDDVNKQDLNALIKKLYKMGLFSDIYANFKNGILRLEVRENPILAQISVKGNKFVSNSDIKKTLNLKEESVFNKNKLEKGIKDLEVLYRIKGRSGTQIGYQINNNKDGSISVVVSIREARSLKISRIRFFGNTKFMDLDLKKIIHSKEFSILRILSSSYYYVEDRVPVDVESLRYFYQSNGYFDFKVEDIKTHQESDRVFIDFYINEGRQYKLGKINVNSHINTVKNSDIKDIVKIKSDAVFSIDKANQESGRIANHLNNSGYLFVSVRPEYFAKDGVVDVTFNILDAKKVYINDINIKGNTRTKDYVIRRELFFAERDPYNQNKVKLSKRALFGLGFFDAVDFISKPIDDSTVDIDLNVKEKTTGYINLSGGYSSDTGFFGSASFTETNFLGTGNKIGIDLKKSIKDFNGSFDFTKKRLFDAKIAGQFSVFSSVTDRTAESSYRMSTGGFKIGADYNITDNLYNNVFYSFKSTNIYDLDRDASESIKQQAGRNDISMIGYSFIYNKLNNSFAPKNGYFARFHQGIAGIGGDLDFVRSEYKLSYFKDLKETKFGDIIFNLSTKGGYIFAYNNQDVLVGQRFFLSDVRGFENAGIGPRDLINGDSLGGNTFMLNTMQIEFPSGLPRELDIRGAVFFDNATLTGIDGVNNQNVQDNSNFRNSIGFSAIWGSPFGRLRVDFGWPITKEDFDKPKVIKFGIVAPTS